nr:hypothetical protein [Tanacetum cinerariifolium]
MLAPAIDADARPGNDGTPQQQPPREEVKEIFSTLLEDIQKWITAEVKSIQVILIGIDNDICSIVDACPNTIEMWKEIERLNQGESINVKDLETNLYWEFRKFTSQDGESLDSYYSRFYTMMNELVRNQCIITNRLVNVLFLLQLKPEWQRIVTIVKQNQDLKNVSYHKLYDMLKQHQNKINEIRDKRLARTANLLAVVAQQQSVYHPQLNPTDYTQSSSTRSQAATKNRVDWWDTNGESKDQELKAHYMYMAKIQEVIPDAANNSRPIFGTEPLQKVRKSDDYYNVIANERQHPEQPESVNDTYLVEQVDACPNACEMWKAIEMFKQGESINVQDLETNLYWEFGKFTSQDGESLESYYSRGIEYNRHTGQYNNQRAVNVVRARETVVDWWDTNGESKDQELKAHYMYMAKIQEVIPDAANNSRPIFGTEPLQKVRKSDDYYNVIANERQHPEQPESVNDTYLVEQGDTNITFDSSNMSNNGEEADRMIKCFKT